MGLRAGGLLSSQEGVWELVFKNPKIANSEPSDSVTSNALICNESAENKIENLGLKLSIVFFTIF